MNSSNRPSIPALIVRQWLRDWEEISFDQQTHRRQPDPHFFLFSLSAHDLRILTGIYRRTTRAGLPRVRDYGIQRRHDQGRSSEIARFVRRGYPWSTLSQRKRDSGKYDDLVKPGWLPTAVVLNILLPEDTRRGRAVHSDDLVIVEADLDAGSAEVFLPKSFDPSSWEPTDNPPLEVIDGQHRLWAFGDDSFEDNYELPVVAFRGLDLSWQAYLFYTINIKPKRINTSLAYDLYPMLRTADWLEKAEEHVVYRETRAQELTEALWSYPESPWYHRIDMLGEAGRRMVTQAAWIRSLIATFVKSWKGSGVQIGGLFGAEVGKRKMVLDWNRPQQSAFLIHLWFELATAIRANDDHWAQELRNEDGHDDSGLDPAFAGSKTLTNTDQGVRGVLAVTNDLCFIEADELELADWTTDTFAEGVAESAISAALDDLRATEAGSFVSSIAEALSKYDWRTSSAPGLSEEEKQSKARFRGGTGYREIRIDLLRHLSKSVSRVAEPAEKVADILGYF